MLGPSEQRRQRGRPYSSAPTDIVALTVLHPQNSTQRTEKVVNQRWSSARELVPQGYHLSFAFTNTLVVAVFTTGAEVRVAFEGNAVHILDSPETRNGQPIATSSVSDKGAVDQGNHVTGVKVRPA